MDESNIAAPCSGTRAMAGIFNLENSRTQFLTAVSVIALVSRSRRSMPSYDGADRTSATLATSATAMPSLCSSAT